MTLKLEQAFFGRGPDGYGILGASPGARPFVARVEALCGGLGTPDGTYGGEPFLLSKPIDEHIVMLCGRRGAPDSAGRETLFFHALVATKMDLLATKTDAFSLFDQGAFATKMPAGEIQPLRIISKSGRDGSPSRPDGGRIVDAALPCVIRSDKPAYDTVRAIVGARALDLPWATFTFQTLSGFDVQVLPHRASIPARFTEYDDSGKLIRTASHHPTVAPSKSAPTSHTTRERPAEQHPNQVDSKHSVMLKLSVAINAMLAAVCVVLFLSRKTPPPQTPPLQEPPARSGQESILEELQGETNRLAIALQEANQKVVTLKAIPRGVSEVERENIIATAKKSILDEVPVVEINICLNSLVGKSGEKGRIQKWLDTIPTTTERSQQ